MATNPFAGAGLGNFGNEMSYAKMGGDNKGAGPLGLSLAGLVSGVQKLIEPSSPMPEPAKWDLKPVVPYKPEMGESPFNADGTIKSQYIYPKPDISKMPGYKPNPINADGTVNNQFVYPKPDINMIHNQINNDWE